MKKIFFLATLAFPLYVAQQFTVFAQRPASAAQTRPPADPNSPPRGMEGRPVGNGGTPIHEHPSNYASGVDTDRFIGVPGHSFTYVWNGLKTRSMLTGGDPYHPGPQGAVLEYRDDLAVATLDAHSQTSVAESPEIYFYYVQGGTGRVDNGPDTQSYDLHTGVGILFDKGAKQHFVNTGDDELSMIMLTWKNNDGMKVKQPMKVVDTATKPLNGANRAHWNMIGGKGMFNGADGVNITASAIQIPPVSYSGPHAHTKGVEEIWVKTGADVGYAILGSEMRKIDGSGAFLAPPNGLTTHSSMNLNEDHAAIWLYLSRRAPGNPSGEGGQ
jgi:mannose-6-phosphate isomerase-like protein (cupin superfamily)